MSRNSMRRPGKLLIQKIIQLEPRGDNFKLIYKSSLLYR